MRALTIITPLSLLVVSVSLASCAGCSLGLFGGSGGEVTILAYNVENLFDDVHNGTEYREYDPVAGDWNTELFHLKAQNIAEVLRSVAAGGADIVALAEVENENALRVLNDTYLKGMGYAVHTCEQGRTAIGVALLTRLPVAELRVHRLVTGGGEDLRDIMEAHIDCRGEELVVFVNHWKSKLGGAEATERDRRAAAALIVRRIRALEAGAVVVAGDLNENWDEYLRAAGAYPTALMPDDAGGIPLQSAAPLYVAARPEAARVTAGRVVLFSPWGTPGVKGSYWYGGAWETIDHTLLGPGLFDGHGLEFDSFEVVMRDFLLTPDGHPFGWSSERAAGYSDHLPILLRLTAF